ncbi:MAG: Bacterial regulatory protein arsR family [Actinomycetota bacterium]
MSDIFVAISDVKRREILESLAKADQTAAELVKSTGETLATVNKHLAVLKSAQLVKASRAKTAVYSINPAGIKPLGVWAAKVAGAKLGAELELRADELGEKAEDLLNQGSTWLSKKIDPKSKVKDVNGLAKLLGRVLADTKKTATDEVTDRVETVVKEVKSKVKR